MRNHAEHEVMTRTPQPAPQVHFLAFSGWNPSLARFRLTGNTSGQPSELLWQVSGQAIGGDSDGWTVD
jgi:hypothetical protein